MVSLISQIKMEHGYSQRSPTVINSIIQHVLDYLPFSVVKRCRLVSRHWHSKAEYLIRKKGMIVFSRYFRPSNYNEYFSQTHYLSAQTITAFEFGSGCFQYTVYELHEFFMKFGKNIKCLRVNSIKVSLNKNELIEKLNIDPFIELLGNNVEELAVFGAGYDRFEYYNKTTKLEISLHKLSNVENILLKNCDVIIDNHETRILPTKLKLEKVTFYQNRKILRSVTVTNCINFQKCSFIDIHAISGSNITFDLLKDFVVANEVSFKNNILVLNWQSSEMKTIKLLLQNSPTQAIGIHSEILEIRESEVDLSYLPSGLKKLSLYQCAIVPCNNELFLPNLKRVSLLYFYKSKFILESVSATMALTITQFAHCPNLAFMEIGGFGDGSNVEFFDVGWLPKSLKILRLNISHRFRFIGRTDTIEIDYLILGGNYCIKTSAVEKVLERIRPKKMILGSVVIFHSSNKLNEKKRDSIIEFLAFIQKEKQVSEIIVKVYRYEGFES